MSEIKVDTLTGKTTANDITVTVGATATMSLEQGLMKVWCAYDSQAQVIDGSLNASSLTDNAQGDTTITHTSTFSAVSEVCFAGITSDDNSSNKHVAQISFARIGSTPFTTTTVRVSTNFDGQQTVLEDMDFIHIHGLGGLA